MKKYQFCTQRRPENSKKYNEQVFYKKIVLNDFVIFTEKYLSWFSFLIKRQTFRAATLSKRDTGVFL